MEDRIPGYDVVDKLHESGSSLIYRASRQSDQAPVILKFLKPFDPPQEARRHFRREYELASTLSVEGVVRTCALVEHRNTLCIVAQDIGGASLDTWLARSRPTTEQSLSLAILVAEALAHLHAANVIHNDLNPSNIIWNPDTGQVEITDFGVATVAPRWDARTKSRQPLTGALAYSSPERTGRIGGTVDHRSDLYSLGVVLFELFTGQLPFRSSDAMTLIHSHIAQRPREPREVDPQVPRVVSDVVMKLLDKDADRRYQSAPGLEADLVVCLDHASHHGDLQDLRLELARHDLSPRLQISKKLYGREAEADTLRRALDRLGPTGAETIVVAGWAGVGKTALIRDFQTTIASTPARFASGKIDQSARSVPYHAIAQTFNELCRDLLMQEPQVLQRFKDKISAALGENGRLLVDIIPDLQRIIGEQPVPPQVGASEAKHRFKLVFLSFIHALCDREHPLVLFLDDLQWADPSTLDLMELMATDTEARFLLLVGAYRDNEVPEGHPLLRILNRIESRAPLSTISLPPLSLSHATTLLADTIPGRSRQLSSLAELLHSKTSGNPFFLAQFIRALQERNLLRYDGAESQWTWDIDSIVAQDITDNVVELTIRRLQLLPPALQQITRIAACIGHSFDLQTLSIVLERSPGPLLDDLHRVAEAGFLVPRDRPPEHLPSSDVRGAENPEFRFLHDRVQQAAYALTAWEDRKQLHATIGRLLLETYSPQELEDHVFSVVEHFNVAHDLLGVQERIRLATLNLAAGSRARESAAHEPASRYLDLGLALLPEDSWQTQYDLTLSLHEEAAVVAYLCGAFEKGFALAEVVLRHAATMRDRARTYLLKIEMEAALLHTPRVIELTVEALEMLGIPLEQEAPAALDVNRLLDLPPMTDPSARAALPILSNCVPAAYQSDLALLHRVVYTMVKLSVRHGNDPHSAFGYVMYGLLLSNAPETAKEGYRFGQMALNVLKQLGARAIECRVEHIFHSHIRFTTDPLREAIGPMQEAIDAGLAAGDLEFVSYISNIRCLNILFSEPDLTSVLSELDAQLRLMKKLRIEHGITFAAMFQQLVLNLAGQSEDGTALVGSDIDERTIAPRLKEVRQLNLLAYLYTAKTIACYLLGDRRAAYDHARTLVFEGYDSAMSSMYIQHASQFYCCLAFLGHCDGLERSERQECLERVDLYHGNLKTLSTRCPENYEAFYLLVAAEKERVTGGLWRASQLYDQTIRAAKEYELLYLEALGKELAGSFWTAQGKDDFAALYLQGARRCYREWGALRKVENLEAIYPQTFAHAPSHFDSASSAPALDVTTFIKASQAISGELDLESLLSKVMSIIVENAGAQKAALVLARDDDYVVKAVASGSGQVEVQRDEDMEHSDALSGAIVRLALRTGEDVLVGEARADRRFSRDPHVVEHQVRSALCIPIRHRERPIGALYLENNLISGAFTEQRQMLLRLLANQAGISLENARLFAEKQRYSAKLRERERDLLVTLNSIGDAVVATDRNLEITRLNPVAERLTGWSAEEAKGKLLDDVFLVVSAGSRARLPITIQKGADAGEHVGLRRDLVLIAREGQEIRISISHSPIKDKEGHTIGLVLVFRDVTEQHLMEEQLRQSQKMEAVGQLAGGIAHDFNNLLTGVLGFADLLVTRVTHDARASADVDMIIDSCTRATELIQKLLTFSRKARTVHEVVDAHSLIKNVLAMLEHSIDRRIEVLFDAGAERSLIDVDATGMQNAILNLGLNARDAMPDGGRLSITTRDVAWEEARGVSHGKLSSGPHIEFRIEDTGTGMPEEVRARVFEPFYTTKETGKGTGLGLSVVYNTIQEARGTIDVESVPGKGTTVRVLVPLADALQAQPPQQEALHESIHGSGRVLLVDDENTIRVMSGSMLTALGYEVLFARDGQEAVEIYRREQETVDLVILDMVMPRMNGKEAFHRLREINPNVKVILSTGCGWDRGADALVANGVLAVLQKPYREHELSRTVAVALGVVVTPP